MLEGKFDSSSVIWFTPKKRKPVDATRFQSGMFMDRADLWKPNTRKRRRRVAKEQLRLIGESDGL